jgi:prefoldin subunit 5
MKKLFILLLAGCLGTASLDAQMHLFLEEQEVDLEDSRSSAWVFPVARNLEEALDDFKDYCKDRSDIRLKKGGENTLIAEKISLPTIATKRGDLIAHCFITEQYYGMAIVFQLGYDISLNSKEWTTEMQNLRSYAKAFMSYHYEQSYARRIDALEKELKDVEKERNQAENKINNLTKKMNNQSKKIAEETETDKIEELEAEINSLEADIKQLMDTLPGLEARITELKSQIDTNKSESNAYQSAIGSF